MKLAVGVDVDVSMNNSLNFTPLVDWQPVWDEPLPNDSLESLHPSPEFEKLIDDFFCTVNEEK